MKRVKKFKIGDRVTHEYLGDATVLNIYTDALSGGRPWAYSIFTDATPGVRYNMGHRECLVFPADLISNEVGE